MANSRTVRQLQERFRDGETKDKAASLEIKGNCLYASGNMIAVRRDWGAGIGFLINGDKFPRGGWRGGINSHVRELIRLLKIGDDEGSKKPTVGNVQIPFSALQAAGLIDQGFVYGEDDFEDFRILDHVADENHYICTTCNREVFWKDHYADKRKQMVRALEAAPWAMAENTNWAHYEHEDGTLVCKPAADKKAMRVEHVLGGVLLICKNRYYLSGIDMAENWRYRDYFLCEIPGPVPTIPEAYEALKPKEVVEAEAAGVAVRRHGDIFFIRTEVTTREIKRPLVAPTDSQPVLPIKVPKVPVKTERMHRLFGTAHVVTEAKINGDTLVRGIVRHKPEGWRNPQHAPLKLGKESWWLPVKNTALGSWNAVGQID